MKSVIAFIAVLTLLGSAQAAPMETKATKTVTAKKATAKKAASRKATAAKKASGKRKVAKKKSRKALRNLPAKSETRSNYYNESAAQMSERAKISEVKPVAQTKKWSGGLYAESYAPIKGVNEGTLAQDHLNDGETDYAASVAYKIQDTVTVSAVSEWMQMWGANEADGSTTLLDPSLRIAKSKLADLGNGIGVNGQARLYLPVSQDSQDREQIALIRLYATASKELTKALSASFTLNPRIYLQQNDTYVTSSGSESNLDTFRLWSSAGLKYSFNDMFAVEQTFGLYQKWKTHTARADYLDASSSMYIAPANWIEFNLGIRQTDGATDTRTKGLSGLYSSDQAEYFFIASFSI